MGQIVYRWGGALTGSSGPVDFLRRIAYVHAFPGRMAHRRTADEVNEELLAWLQADSPAPFFAFLNVMYAHKPYYAPEEHLSRLRSGDPLGDAYHAAIAHLDASLERLFVALEARGQLEQTIVVVTSDHGELLGEHGLTGHGNSLYLPLLNVPLLVFAPGRVPQGVRIQERVSLRDLPATLLEIVGTDTAFPGRSLSTLWLGRPRLEANPVLAEVRAGLKTPDHEPVTLGDMWSVTTSRYHYIVDGVGGEQVFDHLEDALGLHDLAREGRPESLSADLASEIREAGVARANSLLTDPDPPR